MALIIVSLLMLPFVLYFLHVRMFNSNGEILRAWSKIYDNIDPLIGEAEATLLALSKASDLKLTNLMLLDDCATVIESILLSQLGGPSCDSLLPWKIASIILSLHQFILGISFFSSSKIPRAENSAAHSLAAWMAAHSVSGDIPVSFLLNRGLWKYNGAKPP
ncbi:hypothetical protein CJ030_MR2G018730 [Morella rubra]|uniref:RNase H type-1 domain-containing protein n=1 Tax=Morella rubra TaxID=262757 RepID=A0A6A1WD52_9ROSI|nr:hypothetical protein CJ030_MR2G018730 [Morella rubra]